MHWTRFLLLFFLAPILIYASYEAKEYKKDANKTSEHLQRHQELIQQFAALSLEKKESHLHLLHEYDPRPNL